MPNVNKTSNREKKEKNTFKKPSGVEKSAVEKNITG